MKADDLVAELSKYLDATLANDLVNEFVAVRNDCKTGTLGRSAVGKFVETTVQVLQFLETRSYEENPRVDCYLRQLESRPSPLNGDLRIALARIARSTYTLRNKRNIAHKGLVDPNIYDLRYALACAQWILSEIVRQLITGTMSSAGSMIEFIQMPISSVVEDFGTRKIVFGNLTVEKELLLLLHSFYPEYADLRSIKNSLDRRSSSAISNSLRKLWKAKLIHKEKSAYKLTQEGFREAREILRNLP